MKPTVPEVQPAVSELYARHAAGCCLHIVLDDFNVQDQHVEFCINYARENGCQECIDLGETLLKMSKTQRLKLAKNVAF